MPTTGTREKLVPPKSQWTGSKGRPGPQRKWKSCFQREEECSGVQFKVVRKVVRRGNTCEESRKLNGSHLVRWLEGREEGRQDQGRILPAMRTASTKAPRHFQEGSPGAQGSWHTEHTSLRSREVGQETAAEAGLEGPPVPS